MGEECSSSLVLMCKTWGACQFCSPCRRFDFYFFFSQLFPQSTFLKMTIQNILVLVEIIIVQQKYSVKCPKELVALNIYTNFLRSAHWSYIHLLMKTETSLLIIQ